MEQPRLETDPKTGQRVLICHYVGDLYNEAIDQAEAELNPGGEPLAVIAYPYHRTTGTDDRQGYPGGIDCYPNYNHRPKRKADVSFSKFYIGGIRWD